jgi:Gluconate 2-dehydrogenase subunit 3
MSTARPVSRRTALKALGATTGAATLLPWLSDEGLSAFAALQTAKAPPALKVLTAAQYATVEALVEAIIPTDERSPGAKEARVADYIDLLLAEAPAVPKKEWIDGLAALEADVRRRYGAPFARLTPAQAEELLTEISGYETRPKEQTPDTALQVARNEEPKEAVLVQNIYGDVSRLDPGRKRTPLEAFFETTKRATIHGYYTSEIGIHKELRYKGNTILAEFVGCETQDGKDCPHCGQKAQG